MRWESLAGTAVAAIVVSVPAHATVYLTLEQAQQALLPGRALAPETIHLTEAQKNEIEKRSGVDVRSLDQRVWRASDGCFFILDQVIGKHEYITYAVALDANGSVRGIEIMEYRESYGSEVRDANWRQQFVGKTSAAPLTLGEDIKNVGGATLSCRHITDGVKRLLAFYDVALK
jgi:Na+-translocating ferredoxin:NAD+ oxidoreductase RnfG subunit